MAMTVDGVTGYADLHPWTSLGDQTIDEQIKFWKSGHTASQLQQSLNMARKDALARLQGREGVRYLPAIKNHTLLLDKHLEIEAFRAPAKNTLEKSEPKIFKWKISPDNLEHASTFLNAVKSVQNNSVWRLDANALLNFETVVAFWKSLTPEARACIQFVEDPCPYQESHWNQLEELGIPLAIDFETTKWLSSANKTSPTSSHQTYFVFKPAVQNMTWWSEWLQEHPHRFLITSYLDHPVGLLQAQWVAEDLSIEFPDLLQVCGLNLPIGREVLSAYWPGLHLNQNTNPSWQGQPSVGIGFQQMLENLEWVELGNN